VIPEVLIPPPVQLPEGASSHERVLFLARSYRDVIHTLLGKPSRFMILSRGRRLDQHKDYTMVLRAAENLQILQIPPVEWCLFSVGVWFSSPARGRIPLARWVYSGKRMATRQRWFELARKDYSLPRAATVRAHYQLIRDWQAMWEDLIRHSPSTREGVLEVIDQYFPESEYEIRVGQAVAEARQLQRRIDQVVSEGGVWSGR
jgi:hypothetical protein